MRILAIAALLAFFGPLLLPTPASAVCECYNKGRFKRCEPSVASCKASGGDRCYEGCRTGAGPG